MKFNAINNLFDKEDVFVANEASGDYITVNNGGQSMNVALITDKLIEENGLKEVTSATWFKRGSIPTDDGLFSPVIFGETPQERKVTHAYINLRRKFFHPYIFEMISKLSKKIKTVAQGSGCWVIEDGTLLEIKDPQDARYDEDNTGLTWLIENFRQIKFKETGAQLNTEILKLLNTLSDDDIFITKWIVIPIFYRDFDDRSGKKSIPEINYMYQTILQNVNSFDNEILSIAKNITMYKIQTTMVEMRQFGQKLIEKKNGAIQKSIIGKAPDRCGRGVISCPSLNGCDSPNDCIVDILHSGIPLSYCIILGYPFVMKWITEFFEDTFRNKQTMPAMKKGLDGKMVIENVPIVDQTEIYTHDYIHKKLEMFKKTYGAERFETIKIKCKDGTEAEMLFTGKSYARDPDNALANTISNRPMTWTDIVYLASENMLSDKHCYITRYPLEDYFGTFPSKVAVLSTIKTSPVIINGKVYPHYPVIDLSVPPNEVATQFIDTFSISNLYLDAIGGD